jgi:hypothetical protein
MTPRLPDFSDTPLPTPRFGPPTTANPLWRVVVVSGAGFCVCCLLWITAGYANPLAPGNQWLNRHGLQLVVATGAATVGSAVLAMTIDARQTRRLLKENSTGSAEDDVRRQENVAGFDGTHDPHPQEPPA